MSFNTSHTYNTADMNVQLSTKKKCFGGLRFQNVDLRFWKKWDKLFSIEFGLTGNYCEIIVILRSVTLLNGDCGFKQGRKPFRTESCCKLLRNESAKLCQDNDSRKYAFDILFAKQDDL